MQDWAAFRADLAQSSPLSTATIDRLVGVYGSRATEVIDLGRTQPELLQPLSNSVDAIGAELVFTYTREFCRTLTDVLLRRTMIGHREGGGVEVAERAAEILAPYTGWDEARCRREVASYRSYVERFGKPDQAPATPDEARPVNAA